MLFVPVGVADESPAYQPCPVGAIPHVCGQEVADALTHLVGKGGIVQHLLKDVDVVQLRRGAVADVFPMPSPLGVVGVIRRRLHDIPCHLARQCGVAMAVENLYVPFLRLLEHIGKEAVAHGEIHRVEGVAGKVVMHGKPFSGRVPRFGVFIPVYEHQAVGQLEAALDSERLGNLNVRTLLFYQHEGL